MPIGHKKGTAWEREICKLLSLWWSGGTNDAIFYRTGGSGGRATRRGRKGLSTHNHCGDVQASDPVGEPLIKLMTLEIKRGYSTETLHNVLDAPEPKRGKGYKETKPMYQQWIDQAKESAEHARSIGWAIIHRRDKRRTLITLSDRLWWAIYHSYQVNGIPFAYPRPRLMLHPWDGSPPIMTVRLEDFLKETSPEFIKNLVA